MSEYAHNNCDEVMHLCCQGRQAYSHSPMIPSLLKKQGVRDKKGVEVISGGDYIISNATFPDITLRAPMNSLPRQSWMQQFLQPGLLNPQHQRQICRGRTDRIKTTLAYNKAMKRKVLSTKAASAKGNPQRAEEIRSYLLPSEGHLPKMTGKRYTAWFQRRRLFI